MFVVFCQFEYLVIFLLFNVFCVISRVVYLFL